MGDWLKCQISPLVEYRQNKNQTCVNKCKPVFKRKERKEKV